MFLEMDYFRLISVGLGITFPALLINFIIAFLTDNRPVTKITYVTQMQTVGIASTIFTLVFIPVLCIAYLTSLSLKSFYTIFTGIEILIAVVALTIVLRSKTKNRILNSKPVNTVLET
jgi:hypothetical protein